MSERKTAIIIGALIIIAYGTISSLFIESKIINGILELISGIAVIGAAVLYFPILKPHNKNLNLSYFVIKTIEGTLIIISAIILMTMAPSTLATDLRNLLYDVFILYLFGVRFLILNIVFYQSKLVPRFISIWGIIASVLMLVASSINMIVGITLIPMDLSNFPVIINEIFLAVWLIAKGFNKDALIS